MSVLPASCHMMVAIRGAVTKATRLPTTTCMTIC
jgi:hypothetical protein